MMDELGPECAPIEACLPLLVGGELEQPLAEQVQAHVMGCARCRGSLHALESALSHLSGERERVDPRVNLWPDLERELVACGRIVAASPAGATVAHERDYVAATAASTSSPAELLAPVVDAPRRSSWLRRTAFLAAAAGLALVAWRMAHTPASSDELPGVQRDVAHGVEPVGDGSPLVESAPIRGDVVLVGNGSPGGASSSSRSHSSTHVDEHLGAEKPGAPLSASLGVSAVGLRRLGLEEPLLRDSFDPHDSGGDYTLAGSRGLR